MLGSFMISGVPSPSPLTLNDAKANLLVHKATLTPEEPCSDPHRLRMIIIWGLVIFGCFAVVLLVIMQVR